MKTGAKEASKTWTDLGEVLPRKTRNDLEWDRLCGALSDRCESEVGKLLARELAPAAERSAAVLWAREVKEAMLSAQQGEPLPVPPLSNLRDATVRCEHGGVLSSVELRAMAGMLAAARMMRRFLTARKLALPALYEACATDPTLDRLEDEIARCFDESGTLADHATPKLRELRGEYNTSRARMISRIEELMRRYAPILQDGFWTEREGRYVIPVRSDAHERFPGIVHAASGSGSTLFVEPRVLIPLGNRLKMLEAEVRREEELIYAALTAKLAEQLPSVRQAFEALCRADLRAGAAKLARDLQLIFPDPPLEEPGSPNRALGFSADLRALRHPLLVLEAIEETGNHRRVVIPSDVKVAAGRALVVSGPNAGGKTVALKALGLSALMLRAGLPVAAAEGSTLGLVESVLTDVGDDQSLQKSLSTFSAHVTNVASILDEARPGTLVLLDELAGGTDPREGEALAAAILDALCRRGAAVVATTHYEGLKALALGDTRFQNASVGFDESTLMPTFKLTLGMPGASSALSVAKRFGVPSLVIERAQSFLTGEDRTFEQNVRALNDERRALELARSAAEADRIEARHLREKQERELEALRARDRHVLEKEADSVLSSLRRAREELREVQARLRAKKPELSAVAADAKALDQLAGRFSLGGEFSPLIDKNDGREERGERITDDDIRLRKGARVYLPKLRAEGEVLDILADGEVRVVAGALKVVVARHELRVLVDGPREDGKTSRMKPRLRSSHDRTRMDSARPSSPFSSPFGPPPMPSSPQPDLVLQTSDNTVDVRGLRAEDGWPMVESFLDRALNQGQSSVVVVHGHGSGALRDSIRRGLQSSRYIAKFRPGGAQEGGEGVTLVWLT